MAESQTYSSDFFNQIETPGSILALDERWDGNNVIAKIINTLSHLEFHDFHFYLRRCIYKKNEEWRNTGKSMDEIIDCEYFRYITVCYLSNQVALNTKELRKIKTCILNTCSFRTFMRDKQYDFCEAKQQSKIPDYVYLEYLNSPTYFSADLSNLYEDAKKTKFVYFLNYNTAEEVMNGRRPSDLRAKLFELAYALELNDESFQDEILFKGLNVQGFRLRNPQEAIYWYCMKAEIPPKARFRTADSMIAEYGEKSASITSNSEYNIDGTLFLKEEYEGLIKKEFFEEDSREAFMSKLLQLNTQFDTDSTAFWLFDMLINDLKRILLEGELPSSIEIASEEEENDLDQQLKNIQIQLISKLYEFLSKVAFAAAENYSNDLGNDEMRVHEIRIRKLLQNFFGESPDVTLNRPVDSVELLNTIISLSESTMSFLDDNYPEKERLHNECIVKSREQIEKTNHRTTRIEITFCDILYRIITHIEMNMIVSMQPNKDYDKIYSMYRIVKKICPDNMVSNETLCRNLYDTNGGTNDISANGVNRNENEVNTKLFRNIIDSKLNRTKIANIYSGKRMVTKSDLLTLYFALRCDCYRDLNTFIYDVDETILRFASMDCMRETNPMDLLIMACIHNGINQGEPYAFQQVIAAMETFLDQESTI